MNFDSYFGYSAKIVDKLVTKSVEIANIRQTQANVTMIVHNTQGSLNLLFNFRIIGRKTNDKRHAKIIGNTTVPITLIIAKNAIIIILKSI